MKVTRIPTYLTQSRKQYYFKRRFVLTDALLIAKLYMFVLRVSVWDSRQISGLIFRGGNAVRLLGGQSP